MIRHRLRPPNQRVCFYAGDESASSQQRDVSGIVPLEQTPMIKLNQLIDLRLSSIDRENHLGVAGGVWLLMAVSGG